MQRAKPTNHKRLNQRRGTAYILVLSITTLLVTLGIAATKIAQGQIEQGDVDQDVAQVRLAAQVTQDIIHRRNTGTTTWRDGVSNATWYSLSSPDDITRFFAYVDPIDGDLSNNTSDPFVLYTLAFSGTVFRIYSSEYRVDQNDNWTRDASTFKQEVFTD